jgi:hypothetical protein
MRLVTNKYVNGLFDNIALPAGWQITEYVPDGPTASETENINALRQKISTHLPEIVHNLDRYIDVLHRDYDIEIPESYISVDETATFHITILVSDQDYHSPELIAAKLHMHEYLSARDRAVSIQVKFSVAEEYYKSHQTQRVYKLNYLYRNTYAA